MKQHKITLENDFHNAKITVLVPLEITTQSETFEFIQGQAYCDHYDTAAKTKLAKVRRVLCGNTDCQCGIVRPN